MIRKVSKHIDFQEVSKTFGKKEVLFPSSFSIKKDDIVGIIGPSGSGKSTILRLIIGLYRPSAGNINFYSDKKTFSIEKFKHRIGFGFQESSLYEELTVDENFEYFAKLYNVPSEDIKKLSAKLLRLIELPDIADTLVKNLSGGMKKRVEIACSLIHSPEILILDEPMSGLDPLLRKEIWQLIEKINKLGVTLLITTHLLNEVEHICTKIIMLKKGKVFLEGSPEDIKNLYSTNQEISIETYPGDYETLTKDLVDHDITHITTREHKLVIFTKEPKKSLQIILQLLDKKKEKLIDIDVRRPSLNEVFEYFEEND